MTLSTWRARLRESDSQLLSRLMALVSGIMATLSRSDVWHMRRGRAQEALGRDELAQSSYDRVAIDGSRPVPWLHRLGSFYYRTGNLEAAEDAYRLVVELDPGDPVGYAELARALKGRREWMGAAEVYGLGADRGLRRERFSYWRARALERTKDWHAASEAYEVALEYNPTRAEYHERLGLTRQRLGDRRGAMEAYLRASEFEAGEPSGTARLRVAQLVASSGNWVEACELLTQDVTENPDRALSHRALARFATRAWKWAITREGPHDDLHRGRFRALDVNERRELLELAWTSMERAASLSPRPAWCVSLGELRERAGRVTESIEAFQAAVSEAECSDSRDVVRRFQRWEFQLERARHRAGEGRVTDPLFHCDVRPGRADRELADEAPGYFAAEFIYAGLQVEGIVIDPEVDRVNLFLDGEFLRSLTVGGGDEAIGSFSIPLQRETLAHFPARSRLEVTTSQGNSLGAVPLAEAESAGMLELEVPHGTGKLLNLLTQGRHINKKGGLEPTEEELEAKHARYLQLYARVRDHFDTHLGRSLFLMYGTLLGLYRDGDFIPGDDDFDAGYVSDASDPLQVKEETKELMLHLVHAGFTVSFNGRGRLFRVSADDIDPALHLDLRPLWFEDGCVWAHNYLSYLCSPDEFLPVARGTLRDTTVYMPRDTAAFLRAHYGPGWKVPDPGFAYHPEDVDPGVMANLTRALLTPPEYREMCDTLERAKPAPAGRLGSEWGRSLYPLSGR